MSSSDLELARSLSRLLAESPVGTRRALSTLPSAAVEPPDPSRFLRFRKPSPAAAAPLAPAPIDDVRSEALPPPPSVASGGFGAGVYRPILEWALQAAAGDAAFIMDPHGLVVASVGRLDAESAEGYGARLMVALEHARAMSGPDEEAAVVVEIGDRALTAFTAPAFDGTLLTIGLSGTLPAARPIRDALRRALAGS